MSTPAYPSPHNPLSPTHLRDGVEAESGGRMDKGGRGGGGEVGVAGEREREGEQGEVRWSSCVLAVGGRRVVGIGQVRVSLPAGYAVQLRLYVAQAQLRT